MSEEAEIVISEIKVLSKRGNRVAADETSPHSYEDWSVIMENLLHGTPEVQQLAFAKVNRLLSGFLTTLRAWDHRQDWEDLRQVVLMQLVKSFRQGQFREAKAFVSYARTITRNEFFDFLQRHKRLDGEGVSASEEGEWVDYSTPLSVRTAIQGLPEAQQKVIHAVYIEGKTYEEAAAMTTIPLGSLKRYLRLALGKLREQLLSEE